jgi:hypothetical protein
MEISKTQTTGAKSSKMTRSATTASYDYTQSLSKILSDAAANSVGYAQHIIGTSSSTNVFHVKKGTYAGDILTTNGCSTVCWPTGSLCEIIVVANNVKSTTNSLIFTGPNTAPVVGIQVLPSGSVGYSEVIMTDNADE